MGSRWLVLGMGNPILRDDAVGLRLARHLQEQLHGVPGLDFILDCPYGGLDMLPFLEGYDAMVIVDSIRTAGGVPGSWYAFTADCLRETMNLSGVHDANFATSLVLGRRLGMMIPQDHDIHVFAVEIEDNLTFSEGMSETLEASWPGYSSEILKGVLTLLQERGTSSEAATPEPRFPFADQRHRGGCLLPN